MNLTALRQDARYLVFGDNANTQYGDTDIDRNINRWYNYGIACILRVNGDWQVNGEIATTDIVLGQREYILPTDILKISEVYIKSTSTGEYVKAIQRDTRSVYDEPESYNPLTPEIDLLDNSIFINIPEDSITAVPAGIKIHYQSDLVALSAGGDKPNIAEPFQRLISYGAAYDFCIANEMHSKARALRQEIQVFKDELEEFYSQRSLVKDAVLEPLQENLF